MKKYTDVFSWSYEDLKEYDTSIIQHTIPIRPGEKPFRQKLRRINPLLFPLIEKELRKLFNEKIIVKKKNGEIRLCVDFINLNKVSSKDNYPLPKMEITFYRK